MAAPARVTLPAMPDRYVAVIGPADATAEQERQAHTAGAELARRGAVVVTGGLGGVMAAAAGGAASTGGWSLRVLPGLDRAAASPAHTLVLPTELGELRNGLVVRAADAVLAIGGSWGTLSEIALAQRTGVPVVWLTDDATGLDVETVTDVDAALARLADLLDRADDS